MEGKITTMAPIPITASDRVRFRLSEGPITDDFFGAVLVDGSEPREEIDFRTWPRVISSEHVGQLKRFEGGKLALCWCEFIPALSSPYDFYSLSVLGVRALLSHKNNPLSKVLSELERLGRAAGKHLSPGATLEQATAAIAHLLDQGAGAGRLDVHHLFGELPDAPELVAAVPPRQWAEAITLILRLMPGLGPVSQFSDIGAAPGAGLHVPLEEPIAVLKTFALEFGASSSLGCVVAGTALWMTGARLG